MEDLVQSGKFTSAMVSSVPTLVSMMYFSNVCNSLLRPSNYNVSAGSFVKETIDAVDKENFIFEYTVIEGDPALMSKELEKICFQIKFEASPDGGSILKRTSKSYTLEGIDVNEEEIKAAQAKTMEAFVGIFKAFEAYILANPDD